MNETEITSLNPVVDTTTVATSVKHRRSPSAKRAETKAQKEASRGFPLPLVLTCTATGKVVKYTSLAYIRKLITKYGSIDAVRTGYVATEARKPKQ
jgi:hypothetical protein